MEEPKITENHRKSRQEDKHWDRAKAIYLDFTIDGDSSRPIPENVPEWARELFS